MLIGPPTDLATVFNIAECDGPPQGLYLNRGKSLLYIPSNYEIIESPLPRDIPITREGFRLLSCPVGPPSYCEGVLQAQMGQISESLTALHDLNNSYMEATLLRACLALLKFSYILCTCPPDHIRHAAATFDKAIRETLESIIGSPLKIGPG